MREFIGLLMVFIFVGCATNSSFDRGEVMRVDPKSINDTSLGFGAQDLHIVVEKMVSSMLKHQLFDGTPVIDIKDIENRTDEHIDTKAITDSIRTMVIKSNRARFVDSSMRPILIDELNYQNSNKYMDKTKSKQIGKHISQGYILDGAITAIKQRNNNQISYFYKVVLQLHNIETASIDWIDEQEIRKVYIK